MTSPSVTSVHGIKRRKILTAGTAATLGIAGCLGGDDSEDDDIVENDSEDDDIADEEMNDEDGEVDKYFRLPTTGPPPNHNFNGHGETQFYFPMRLLWENMAQLLPETQEYAPWLSTNIESKEESVVVSIREGINWHSGQSLNAEDVANHYRVSKAFRHPIWDYTEDIELINDYELQFNIQSVNPNVFEPNLLLYEPICTHPELHQEFIERERDLTTDDELEELAQDLAQYEITPEEGRGTIGNGPVDIGEVTESTLYLEKHDEYPIGWDNPSTMNWKGYSLEFVGDDIGASWDRAVLGNDIDAHTVGTDTAEVYEQADDHWYVLERVIYTGESLAFSPESKWGEDTERSRALRQALAYLLDTDEMAGVAGPGLDEPLYTGSQYQTGLTDALDETWLDEVLDNFTDYGTESQPEEASEQLRDAGFERNEDDVWEDGDTREPLTAELKFHRDWGFVPTPMRNAAEQMSNFGIETEPVGEDGTTYTGTTLENDNFEIGYSRVGNRDGIHPYQSFRRNMGSLSDDKTYYNNDKETLTVPWPPYSPSGEESINIDDRINELASTTDSEREAELIEELAWIFNQWLPLVEAYQGPRTIWISFENFDYGVDTDDQLFRSEQCWAYLTRTGDLTAIEE